MYEGVVQDLIDELGRLPGVGPKSAQRIAFHLLAADPADVRRLVHALTEVKDKVRFCAICGNVAEDEQCRICRDPRRDPTVLCVVEEPKDVVAIEKTREFRGRYHVLGGAISPIDGHRPDDLRIRELMARLADGAVTEVILATDPNLEGEATATYLARLVKPMGLRVTRLASGPAGRRRPGVRRRGHPGPSLRGTETAGCLTDRRAAARDEVENERGELSPAGSPTPRSTCAPTSRPPTTVASGDQPRRARCRCCCSAVASCCSPAPGWAPSTTSCPTERFEPDAGPEPDVDPLRERAGQRCSRADRRATPTSSTRTCPARGRARLAVRRPRRRRRATSRTACSTSRPAGSTRRCGGGSSRTCPAGVPRGERAARRSSRSWRTCGWTPTTRSSSDAEFDALHAEAGQSRSAQRRSWPRAQLRSRRAGVTSSPTDACHGVSIRSAGPSDARRSASRCRSPRRVRVTDCGPARPGSDHVDSYIGYIPACPPARRLG